jgi:uncharacterized protein YcbK (DUF882 family)
MRVGTDFAPRPDSSASRRRLLKLGLLTAAATALPRRSLAADTTITRAVDRRLSFLNTHTGEDLDALYCCGGEYVPDALASINHILRDFRVNEARPIDPRLLDLLHRLGDELGVRKPYHVISGYRSPKTNAMLRAKGGSTTGVASRSLHMVGKAIDVRVPGVDLVRVRDTARRLRIGGVGYYPASDFVHVDVGRVRYW